MPEENNGVKHTQETNNIFAVIRKICGQSVKAIENAQQVIVVACLNAPCGDLIFADLK